MSGYKNWVRAPIRGLVLILLAAIGGCVAYGGGDYGYGGGAFVGYDVGYQEPFGYDYGGWQPGYRVGPPPRGGYEHGRHGEQGDHHAYRPAPPSRPIPSIPSQGRGGGSQGGRPGGAGHGGR